MNKPRLYNSKRSIRFYKYLFSYIMLAAISLMLLGGIVYNNFIVTLQRQVEDANIAKLKQAMATMDTKFKEMELTAIQITNNPKLTPFMVSSGGYGSYDAVNELNKYKSGNSFISDIALYYNYRSVSKIYAASGVYDMDAFFNHVYRYNDWDDIRFINDAANTNKPYMRPIEPVKKGGLNKAFATYVYPLPTNVNRSYGVAMFLIEDNALSKVIRPVLEGYKGYAYILNEQNKVVISVSSKDSIDDAEDVLKALNVELLSPSVSTAEVSGQSYSVVKLASDYNGWSYIVTMPKAQFMQKVYNSRNIFNYAAAVVLIIGILMAFIFSSRDYKPWQSLAEVLKGQKNNDSVNDGYADEVAFVSDAIAEMNEERNGLMSQLKSQAALVKDQILLILLKGKFKNLNEMVNLLSVTDVKLDKRYFTVLFFLIDDYADFEQVNSKPMQDILKYSMVNAIEELFSEIGYGYGIDLADDKGIALVLNFDMDADVERHIGELAYKTKDFFKEHFNFTMTVGVGNIYDDAHMVYNSFKEAGNAAYYRLVKGKDQVIFYKDIKRDELLSRYWYPAAQEAQLIKAINQGDDEGTARTIGGIIADIKRYPVSPEITQFIYFGLINAVLKALNQTGINIYDVSEIHSLGTTILNFESMKAVENSLIRFCTHASSYVRKYAETKRFDLIDEITGYIEKHVNDRNLSLESIAEEFGLSSSYITAIFKERTGYTLMRYVDMIRMDMAKRLLEDTDKPLKDILEVCGYIDETNFIRKFKKNEGVTPMQYRSEYKAKRACGGIQ